MSKTAVNPYYPFVVDARHRSQETDDSIFFSLNKNYFLRYYIGISDLRGKGKLIDQSVMSKIEKHLSLKGVILVLEVTEQIILADIIRPLRRRLINGELVDFSFRLVGDVRGETYTVKELGEEKETKLFIFDSRGQELFIFDTQKMVLFYNNDDGEEDLVGVDIFLSRMKEKLDDIDYDAKSCRKRMGIITPGRVAPKDMQYLIDGFESNDYFFNVAYKDTLKSRRKQGNFSPEDIHHQIVGPENSREREQLWRDYLRLWAETCKYFGVQFNISWKEERQNQAEIGLIDAPFKAWEKERKKVRVKALKRCEEIGWLEPGWELVYGGQTETNAQKIMKLEEELKIMDLEEQIEIRQQKKSLVREEKKTASKKVTNAKKKFQLEG